jgi:single-stranded-DNA-specific exonuclease
MHRLNIPEKLAEDLKKASESILSHDSSIRVFSHHDADGISAASILAKALFREGKEFHLSIVSGITDEVMEKIEKERDDFIIFLDMGSGDIEKLDKLDAEIIVLDHHRPLDYTGNVLEINSHRYGIDGTSEASGSTMSFLLSLAMSRENSDLVHLSLSGSTGDRQHVGGFKGINSMVAELGEKEGVIEGKKGLNLRNLPVKDAISRSTSPFFRGLSGRDSEVDEFLKPLGINGEKRISELSEEEEKKLNSALLLRLLKQGCRPDVVDELITWKYFHKETGLYVSEIADFMESTAKKDAGIGVSLGLGDESALYRAKEMYESYSEELMKALLTLEKNGAIQMEHIQWFWTYSSEVGSAQAGIGMQYLLNQEKPVFALTEGEEDNIKISARGTKYLISKGLDLSEICRQVAKNLGGKGGGHNIASGCTIPKKKRKEFLKKADEMVKKQIFEE